MNNLLVDRKYDIIKDKNNHRSKPANWYTALEFLKTYKSVIAAEWCDTSSSAGDWSGFLIQKIGNRNYMIAISQENNWPKWGYTLYTGDLLASWKGDYKKDDAMNIYNECMEMLQ